MAEWRPNLSRWRGRRASGRGRHHFHPRRANRPLGRQWHPWHSSRFQQVGTDVLDWPPFFLHVNVWWPYILTGVGAACGASPMACAGTVGGAYIVGQQALGMYIGSKVGATILQAKGGRQNIVPSWAEGARPLPGESASEFADRLCTQQYPPNGAGCGQGPGSERSKIRKWARDKFGI